MVVNEGRLLAIEILARVAKKWLKNTIIELGGGLLLVGIEKEERKLERESVLQILGGK